jgi:hypothetical protein
MSMTEGGVPISSLLGWSAFSSVRIFGTIEPSFDVNRCGEDFSCRDPYSVAAMEPSSGIVYPEGEALGPASTTGGCLPTVRAYSSAMAEFWPAEMDLMT